MLGCGVEGCIHLMTEAHYCAGHPRQKRLQRTPPSRYCSLQVQEWPEPGANARGKLQADQACLRGIATEADESAS